MKSFVRIHLQKGTLPGYSLTLNKTSRRSVLTKLAKEQGWGTVVKKLNVLRLFNKNKHPETAEKFGRDLKFVQTLSPKYKHKSKSKKRSKTSKVVKRKSPKKSKRKSKKRSKKRSSKVVKRKSPKKRTKKRSKKRSSKAVKRKSPKKRSKKSAKKSPKRR